MIRSQIISKYSVILIFIVATLFTIIKINTGFHSKIDINKSFQGKITNYTNNEDYTKIEIKGKQESVIAYVKGSVKFNLGDYIEVSGTYKIPSANTIPNNFNYQKYLYNKKIFYTMNVQNYKIIKVNENILYNLKENIISKCNNYEYGNYIKSFVLGDKTELDNYDMYQGNGVSHLFALSGMHISFLTYFIMLLLKKVPYKEYFAVDCMYEVKPYEGIPELITALKEKGIRLAVLSNKPHLQTIDVIETLFGADCFDVIQGQQDGIPIKPDPSGVFEIMKKLNVTADEILYLGDTATDMKTGKGAGAYTLGVLWGFRERRELEDANADAIISHPLEALQYLD